MAKLLINQGSAKVLALLVPVSLDDKVDVLSTDPNIIMELAGRTAYRSYDRITKESAKGFVDKLANTLKHLSVIEHSAVTIKFSKVSRGFTHEIVRHRISKQMLSDSSLSITQESTRYVDCRELELVVPPHREHNLDKIMSFANDLEKFYRELRNNGWRAEDARQFLPIGVASEIVITTNFRDWLNICSLRTGKEAHWEMRLVFCNHVIPIFKKIAPVLFDKFEIVYDKDNIPYCVEA